MIGNRTVRICPYANCGWQYEEPPIEPTLNETVEAQLERHVANVEAVIIGHLDQAHPGWTIVEVEREAIQQQVRAVFNASPFGPTIR